jgi:hypothetical protein
MLVTKTPHRNAHLVALAKTNDQLCFFLFADAELEPKLAVVSAEKSAEFTTKVFPANPYAERIHVTVKELAAFRAAQISQTLGMSLSFAVEQLLVYVEQAVLHWAEINKLQIKITDPIEDCLADFCKVNAKLALSIWLPKTIKYLRLRRNHYIHLAEDPSAELAKFLKYDAPGLQAHWLSRTSMPGLSFSSGAITTFGPDESITLIKIMRVCIEDLDAYLAPHIDATTLAKNLHTELLQRQPELRPNIPANLERRVRKVKKRAKEIHGLSATREEIACALGIAI